MTRWRGRRETCPVCGTVYEDFRSEWDGKPLTYSEVRMLLWVASENYADWKYKRRHTVLGLWHQIKRGQWREHLYYCEMIAMAREEARRDKEMEEKLPEEKEELAELLEAYEERQANPDLSDIPF